MERREREPQMGEGTVVGQYCVIGSDVSIGRNCVIGHGVILHEGTTIGDGVRIDDYAVLGKKPLRAARSATTSDDPLPPARIGSGSLIGTGAVVYRGATVGEQVLLADGATLRENSRLGDGTIVGRGSYVENHCQVGSRCKIQSGVYLCAFSQVGDDCFLAPGVVTSNDNYLGRDPKRLDAFAGPVLERGARLGAGAVVLPGRHLFEEAAAGAGSVVTHNVPSGELWVGNPARKLRQVPDSQLLENQPD